MVDSLRLGPICSADRVAGHIGGRLGRLGACGRDPTKDGRTGTRLCRVIRATRVAPLKAEAAKSKPIGPPNFRRPLANERFLFLVWPMKTDEQAIRDLIDTWFAATKSGDVATVLKLMARRRGFHGPRTGAVRQGGLRRRQPAGLKIDGSSEIVELKIQDDWAWIRTRIK